MDAIAYQSSTSGDDSPDKAIDGDLATCSKTTRELNAFWGVDLGSTHIITNIVITMGKNRV